VTFADGTFEEIDARARAEGKVLVANFTASWCEPCKIMDRECWPASAVVAWLAAHAGAVRIDVDQRKDLRARFGVRSLPTVIVFRNGEVLDRRHGVASATSFVAWLDGVLAGRRWEDELRLAAARDDVKAHHDLAGVLITRGDLPAAFEELMWVWDNALALRPEYVGVRHSFLVEELRAVAAKHPPARERLVTLRDAAGGVFAASPSHHGLREWSSLARASGDTSSVTQWFDALTALPEWIDVIQLELAIRDDLNAARRATLGRFHPPASECIARLREQREWMTTAERPDDLSFSVDELAREMFHTGLARARKAYVAAGRNGDVRMIDAVGDD
jgi:thioredoxin 1